MSRQTCTHNHHNVRFSCISAQFSFPLPAPSPSTCSTNLLFHFQSEIMPYSNSGIPFLLYLACCIEWHISCGTHTHCGVNQWASAGWQGTCEQSHISACVCWAANPNSKQTEINTPYRLYHCIAGITPRPGCVRVWSLSLCLRSMLIRGGGCQLSHIGLYLSCSHSLWLRLSLYLHLFSSTCLCSCQTLRLHLYLIVLISQSSLSPPVLA